MKSRYAFALFMATIALTPLVLMLVGSVKEPLENLRIPPTLIPNSVTFDNYALLAKYPLLAWTLNTFIVCGAFTAINILITVFFGFSCVFRKGLQGVILVPVAIFCGSMAPDALLIPRYLLVRFLGLFNTRWAMILPFLPLCIYGPLSIIYLRTFPRSVLDSAEMDGCSTTGRIFRILIPNIRPLIAFLGLASFIGQYGSLMWQSLVAPGMKAKTLSVGIATVIMNDLSSRIQSFPNFSMNLAAATVTFIPLLIMFLCVRKTFRSYAFHQGVT